MKQSLAQRALTAILAGFVLGIVQGPSHSFAENADLAWMTVTSDRFSLAAMYPSELFHDPLMTYGAGDTVWLGPNKDGAALMISAIIAGSQTPEQKVCESGCPNPDSKAIEPSVAAVSGHIEDKVYHSKCLLAAGRRVDSQPELHCFHMIYNLAKREVYDPIADHIAATLR